MVITAPEYPFFDSPNSGSSTPSDLPSAHPPSLAASTREPEAPSTTFLVGSSKFSPFISRSSLSAHLRLLDAFYTLERSIGVSNQNHIGSSVPSQEVQWRVFVHQSVWRFSLWLQRVVKVNGSSSRQLRDEEIPPLDVLLVWHAYLLNPLVYADDTMRTHPELAAIGGFPIERIASQIHFDSHQFEPTPAQVSFWELTTLTKYNPLTFAELINHGIPIECPRCDGTAIMAPWLRRPRLNSQGHAEGNGWCQNQFKVSCSACGSVVTRESVAVGRFAADIAKAMVDKRAVLAGTLFDPTTCTSSPARARLITTLLLQPFVDLPPTQRDIGEHLGWSFVGIQKSIQESRAILSGVVMARKSSITHQELRMGLPTHAGRGELRNRLIVAHSEIGSDVDGIWRSFGPRITKMFASYRDNPTSFSVELVGAVLRQTSFTSKVHGLGWLNSTNPQKPPIEQCIERYHKFLHLLACFPSRYLVPSLDIDLGWHTHQLSGSAYMCDMKRCIGRFVDHDDKVEEGMLCAFDTTSMLWKRTFQMSYSSWELRPQASSMSLAKLFKLVRGRRSSPELKEVSSSSLPGPSTPGTYPSEHQSIVVIKDDKIARSRSQRERLLTRQRPPTVRIQEPPFLKRMDSIASTAAFGELGLEGWALLGHVDCRILNAKELEKGQCCAGYNIPYYSGPIWGANHAIDVWEQ